MRAFIASEVSAFAFAINLLISLIFPRGVSKEALRSAACLAAASYGPSASAVSIMPQCNMGYMVGPVGIADKILCKA